MRFRILVRRVRFKGRIKIRVIRGLPAGAKARFAPRSVAGSHTVLIIRTSTRTPAGSYQLQLQGKRGRVRGRVVIVLTVGGSGGGSGSGAGSGGGSGGGASGSGGGSGGGASGSGGGSGSGGSGTTSAADGISGDVSSPLEPGQAQGIDLAITNTNSQPLDLTSLTVTISGINAPHATASLPCPIADFTIQQYSYSYLLVIPPSSTRTLQQLQVPSSDWPQVSLLDRPTNQDGCQGASLSLTYGSNATPG